MSQLSSLTGAETYFEDFPVGRKMRHARGATIDEVENNYLSKLVVNTAQGHWNEHALSGATSMLGSGRVVFGLLTASMVFGLASQDTSENAVAEVRFDKLRFLSPVHHGDTIYALTEVIAVEDSADWEDAGLVTFKHWGITHEDRLVFEGERTVLIKRRRAWSAR